MKMHKLQLIAFIVDDTMFESQNYYVLDFPDKWYNQLKNLYLSIIIEKKPHLKRVNFPSSSLEQLLFSVFPSVRYTKLGLKQWLISSQEIPVGEILKILKVWISSKFLMEAKKKSRTEAWIKEFMESMDSGELTWNQKKIHPLRISTHINQTAQLEVPSYHLLPSYMVQMIAEKGLSIKIDNQELYFKSFLGSNSGKELISWPPLRNLHAKRDSYYSIALKISLQTIPFYPKPLLLIKPSIRRWVSQSLIEGTYINLPMNNTSLYMVPSLDLVESNPYTFTRGYIKYSTQKGGVIWADDFPYLFEKLSFKNKTPNIMNVIENPVDFLLHPTNPLAISYSNFFRGAHSVAPGLSLTDKKDLTEGFHRIFPNLEQVVVERVTKSMPRQGLLKDREEIEKGGVQKTLREIVGKRIKFEIYYQDSALKKELVHHLESILGLENHQQDNGLYETKELTVHMEEIKLGKIGSSLEVDRYKSLGKAYKARLHEIKDQLAQPSEPTAVLIELKKDWKKNNEDPKIVLRHGFALCNRWTQFITPIKEGENVEARAKNAVWDLFRQMGYVSGYLPVKLQGSISIPNDLSIFVLWMVKDNNKERIAPVVLNMNTRSLVIKVKAPFTEGIWLHYGDFLLKMVHAKEKKYNAIEFFKRVFMEDIINCGDSLVLCSAENIRSELKWFTNGAVEKNEFWFEENGMRCAFDKCRVIRLRTKLEVADWYGVKTDGGAAYTSGLFISPLIGNIFWSKNMKSTVEKNVKHDLSKVNQNKPFKAGALLEIVPLLLKEGDDPMEWAYLAHKMRGMLSYYNESVTLPFLLHLGKKLNEYIMRF